MKRTRLRHLVSLSELWIPRCQVVNKTPLFSSTFFHPHRGSDNPGLIQLVQSTLLPSLWSPNFQARGGVLPESAAGENAGETVYGGAAASGIIIQGPVRLMCARRDK